MVISSKLVDCKLSDWVSPYKNIILGLEGIGYVDLFLLLFVLIKIGLTRHLCLSGKFMTS